MLFTRHRRSTLFLSIILWVIQANLCLGSSSNPYGTWPEISIQEQNAIRSERDIQNNITIDQLPYVGVNLQSVLFNNQTTQEVSQIDTTTSLNGTDTLNNFSSLLNQGIGSFILDVENKNRTWYILDSDIQVKDFLSTLDSFLDQSNNNLSANIILFMLRVHVNVSDNDATVTEDDKTIIQGILNHTTLNSTIRKDVSLEFDESEKKKGNSSDTQPANLNLTVLIEQNLNTKYIYKPSDLLADNNLTALSSISTISSSAVPLQWPTLEQFLYAKLNRIVITELSTMLNNSMNPYVFPNTILHLDKYNSTLGCPTNTEEFRNISSIQWRLLEAPFDYNGIQHYMHCGLSPIITNSFSILNITTITPLINRGIIWSWKKNEPRLSNSRLLMGKDSMQAYNCAMLKFTASNGSAYFQVDNCYSTRTMVCKNNVDPFTWTLSEDRHKYFTYYNDDDDMFCPENYTFSLPITQLEQRSLDLYLDSLDTPSFNLWINLNSIAVSNCWLIGDKSYMCPYTRSVSKRNFVSMLVPVVVIAAALLVCVLYLSLLGVPIHDNRKNWRKVVNKISKSEMEGVPS
ncbi:similar to Saccharomyces cerevisiae YHR151C MTC6 Protein of unknown function [Maudiozyma barnettii]|uniref:Maintenance of telomere capping protein 6 n=1 Tax=Maudiozyma barnettii TaxID=61262 RepID=A0A8H2ZHL4_9SACH|nr:Mtc6p [Kazachstania barnettii]CAB4254888.1 similar to Saccharomyces cerevisiae YHR151C MTC6 Protein of unknown function [Kazachstania barnettii]CAD1783137.1 similar to Saccharomyces cerevisiae YHR151C MTC6 Protein of unknown function [Kazachstania barnettii]